MGEEALKMASGDLPKDFPLNEANLLAPMIHLLLDKAEEMARKSELPPQYPNDQDKYDEDLWSLEPNKPDYFKSGIECVSRQEKTAITTGSYTTSGTPKETKVSSIVQKIAPESVTSANADVLSTEPAKITSTKGTYIVTKTKSMKATQGEKSSLDVTKELKPVKKGKTSKMGYTKRKDRSPKQTKQVKAAMPRRSVNRKLKTYHAVPSRTRKSKKPISRRMSKEAGRMSSQVYSAGRNEKPLIKLNDYFDGIDPNNGLYRTVFKLRQIKKTISGGETRQTQLERARGNSYNITSKSTKRTNQPDIGMVDMPTEVSIPCCPVHRTSTPCKSEMQQFKLPLDFEKKTFEYKIKAWKDGRATLLPTKVIVRRLTEKEGIDVRFAVDTSTIPGVKPFILRAYCPDYDPRRAWINGKLCLIE